MVVFATWNRMNFETIQNKERGRNPLVFLLATQREQAPRGQTYVHGMTKYDHTKGRMAKYKVKICE